MSPWIEAIRVRTLPASIAGVLMGVAIAAHCGPISWAQGGLCLLFALLAQIASNFANEYFDFRNGLDKKGREGFRRGVTEGDISPGTMLGATLGVIGAACVVGLTMLWLSGEWWILIPGALVPVFALAYSAGPWPLSHHGLGDLAVVIFFGVVPVTLTAYLCGHNSWDTLPLSGPASLAIGLLGANILIVNNYRDADDDRAVGKHTTVVLLGRKTMSRVYLLDGVVAVFLLIPVWIATEPLGWPIPLRYLSWVVPVLYLALHTAIWRKMTRLRGASLNPLLGLTAANLLLLTLLTAALLLATPRF